MDYFTGHDDQNPDATLAWLQEDPSSDWSFGCGEFTYAQPGGAHQQLHHHELMNISNLFNTEETALQGPMHDQSTSWQDPYQLGQFPNLIDDGMLQMPDLVAPAATEVTATATGSTGKPFNCTVTGCNSKGFMRRYELERHTRKHNRTEVFPCPVSSCPFSRQTRAFYRRDKLQSHLRKVHPGHQAANNGVPSATGPAQGQAEGSV
ncbi:hypothetical protein SLS54_008150 [Diplodia seriata]